nr:succinate dehydrogenase 7 [Viscum album]
MAFLLNKPASFSRFRSVQKAGDSLAHSCRGFHIAPGAREKALLEPDPALKKFKPTTKSVRRLKLVMDAVTVAVVAGSCYEIYVRSTDLKEKLRQAKSKSATESVP